MKQFPEMKASAYKPFSLHNFRSIPQLQKLSPEQLQAIKIVGNVLPFKTNNYVINQLIDWRKAPFDPFFILNFPQKEMLLPHHFKQMKELVENNASPQKIRKTANEIRLQLNPHPAGQLEYNAPILNGQSLEGMQHKYRETVLFFPLQGQTCHAYCSFCFRWPQFVGLNDIKFAAQEAEKLVEYVRKNSQVTDVLFTGGDPLIMKTSFVEAYVRPLLEANPPNLKSIRIGTKALSYWPYRFLTDDDSKELLELFAEIGSAGKHLAIMAHFNHPRELETSAAQKAIQQIRLTGAQIRTQSPLLRYINESPEIWRDLWQKQVELGCIPYYFFVARDTGAQHYFGVPLHEAQQIFRKAYQQVSGLARTVRGPSMSCGPGKVQVLGVQKLGSEKVFVLQFLQGRNPDWVLQPFLARFDPQAIWFDDLKPAFGKREFFFEKEYRQLIGKEEPVALQKKLQTLLVEED